MKSYNCFVTFKITSFWFPMKFGSPCLCQDKNLLSNRTFSLGFFFSFFKRLSTTWSFCWSIFDFPLLEMLVCSSFSSFKNVVFSFGSFWIVVTRIKLFFALLLRFWSREGFASNCGMSHSFLFHCGQVRDVALMVACKFDLLACIGVDLSSCNDFVVCGANLGGGSLMLPIDELIVLDLVGNWWLSWKIEKDMAVGVGSAYLELYHST